MHDVASSILQICGEIPSGKLQKLLYYCQAWSMAWEGKPIFDDYIEAWPTGPVVLEVYRGHPDITTKPYDTFTVNRLSMEDQATVEAVVSFYGGFTSQLLMDSIRTDGVWSAARLSNRLVTAEALFVRYKDREPDPKNVTSGVTDDVVRRKRTMENAYAY